MLDLWSRLCRIDADVGFVEQAVQPKDKSYRSRPPRLLHQHTAPSGASRWPEDNNYTFASKMFVVIGKECFMVGYLCLKPHALLFSGLRV